MVGGGESGPPRQSGIGQVDGRAIRALRVRKGWTLKDLADRAGVSERALQDIENGVTTQPRPQTIQWLAQALGVQPELLWAPIDDGESPRGPLATVIARDESGAILNRWDVYREHVRIGRDARNDVVLADGRVSLFHALVTLRENHAEVRDLNSGNGTYVAAERIREPRAVRHGEGIGIRPYAVEIHRSAPAPPAATVPFAKQG